MSQRAAIRRRRQFSKDWRHLAKLGRPKYPGPMDAAKARRRLQQAIEKQRMMQSRKSANKK